MMTRKDYVAVAKILNASALPYMSEVDFEELVADFSDFFLADNPNFSPNRFEMACLED